MFRMVIEPSDYKEGVLHLYNSKTASTFTKFFKRTKVEKLVLYIKRLEDELVYVKNKLKQLEESK